MHRNSEIRVATNKGNGQIPEWPNGADCKSAGLRLRWFESIFAHTAAQLSTLKVALFFFTLLMTIKRKPFRYYTYEFTEKNKYIPHHLHTTW